MSIETTLPYSWLKTLAPDIKMLDEVPLWGSPPAFPWEEYSTMLGQILDIPGLKIVPGNVEWKLPELNKDLGENPVFHAFSVSPLEGFIYLIFPKEDLKNLFQTTIPTSGESSEEWHIDWDEEWQDEFYQYLALQAIQAFQKVKYDPSLSPQILNDASLPNVPCLCIDLSMVTPVKTITGKLLISPEIRQSIKKKYTAKTLGLPKGLSGSLTATVHVSIGNTVLSKKEWNAANPGDFLLLDSCTLPPGEEKGRVILTVNNSPIFRAKIKEGSLKLLEYPLLQEVQTPMAKQHDEEFDETFETEDETHSDTNHEIDPFEEDNSLGLSENGLAEDIEEDIPPLETIEAPLPSKDLLGKPAEHTPLVKPEEIPLTISIEIARIQMSVEQLSQLSPGNMLDLNITPENGVDLVVNGHCIGKGELLKLGDTLGVRILDKA